MGNLLRKTYAKIDTGAIENNVRAIRAHIGERSEVMAVVKADAYGHGAVKVARAALSAGAGSLAVALAEEAAPLRGAGMDCPILVMGQGNEPQYALGVKLGLAQ